MEQNQYIFAMYDIRGKQNYIYKSSKLKEIVGASLIIRDCFIDYLFPAAEEVAGKGLYSYRVEKRGGKYRYKDGQVQYPFSEKEFLAHLEEGFIGEVVYDGGGNFLVLYKDFPSYQKVNRIFYRKLLKGTYSLQVLTSYIEGVDFSNYAEDNRKLYAVHAIKEREECAVHPVNALPIVQVDYQGSMPLATEAVTYGTHWEKVSLESAAKYEKYRVSMDRKTEGARILDDMIMEKGKDSHLAVIYIDGNNMGAKVQEATKNCRSYDQAVTALRKFSNEIQKYYIDIPMDRIDRYFNAFPEDGREGLSEEKGSPDGSGQEGNSRVRKEKRNQKRRFVIYAGDEITFVCGAEYAYDIVEEYFKALKEGGQEEIRSSCAGIAIFHSHAPYAEAYRIAEECCESGKKLMKEKGIQEACFMDFHYCQGAIGTSLEKIRKHEGTETLCRPWLLERRSLDPPICHIPDKGKIEDVREILQSISHSNSKGLLYAAKAGMAAFEKELARIRAHLGENDRDVKMKNGISKSEAVSSLAQDRELVYQMMLVYDLWFRKVG